jgi:hypothetical protein
MAAKYSLHALRHAAASLFIAQGWTPKKVQTVMGHSSIAVTCGAGAKAVNVYFSEGDLAEGKAFKAPVHIDQTRAVRLCEDYAKSAANFPSTVDFSRLWDLAVTEHPNGNTTVLSSFRAKNAFGLELEHNIRCLLNAGGLIEANIFEKR